jgi:hypothetical protein
MTTRSYLAFQVVRESARHVRSTAASIHECFSFPFSCASAECFHYRTWVVCNSLPILGWSSSRMTCHMSRASTSEPNAQRRNIDSCSMQRYQLPLPISTAPHNPCPQNTACLSFVSPSAPRYTQTRVPKVTPSIPRPMHRPKSIPL